MASYLDRIGARDYVRAQGIPVGDTSFANLASDGKGPRYSIINGRALYKPADLNAWIEAQANVTRRRRRRDQPDAA